MDYPNIENNDFYKKINSKLSKYKIPKKKKTFKEICNPVKYELQLPQKFVSAFINPDTPYKGVLVYHRIGAGKTCAAIRVGEVFKKKRNIIVVLPASLKGNFRTELRSLCAGEEYLTNAERKELAKLHPSNDEYKKIIKKSDERIDKYYQIFSYNKFIEKVQKKKMRLDRSLLIIDEIQNMVSEEGTYYVELFNLLKKAPADLRTILLSATPMFDKPHEIGLTINLLRPINPLPVGNEFDKTFISINKLKNNDYKVEMKNSDIFKNSIKGYISYFRGAPSYVFPEMKLKYVKCEMDPFQYSSYREVINNEENEDTEKIKKKLLKTLNVGSLPNHFFIGTRFISNVVFPNKKVGAEGLESFTKMKILGNLEKYSTKFHKIMSKINGSTGKIFVYSSFKEYAGLKSFIKVLEAFGYSNYSTSGEGAKRFAVWSGDESMQYKEEIKSVYNMKDNLNGSKLKVILGSSSIKEGVSFSGVRQVHIIDPYWNLPRLEQVIGRASRFCSHKDLDKENRNVKVYIYLATAPSSTKGKKLQTVDEYIHELSTRKNKLVNEFELAVKEAAVDCELNATANMNRKDKYICDK
jgi:hypothetical protein